MWFSRMPWFSAIIGEGDGDQPELRAAERTLERITVLRLGVGGPDDEVCVLQHLGTEIEHGRCQSSTNHGERYHRRLPVIGFSDGGTRQKCYRRREPLRSA